VCHSEEHSDEESAFDLLSWRKNGSSAKQLLHEFTLSFAEGFSMTQQQLQMPDGSMLLLAPLLTIN
jgi:hypothetical protein